jgi:pyridoxal phosphate enzyme (YggS family)
MNVLAERLEQIQSKLPDAVTLIAVSKLQPIEALKEAYNAGQRNFGENYVQELVEKSALLPNDINWHFIGRLQTNKVKYIAPFVHLIHGVDSLKLLHEVDKQATKQGRIIDVLLQAHVAREETKSGFLPQELEALFTSIRLEQYTHVRFRGIMGMASFTDNQEVLQTEFKTLRSIFEQAKKYPIGESANFDTLSMGMSSDWSLAISEGSTMVRIGSAIFGERKKPI